MNPITAFHGGRRIKSMWRLTAKPGTSRRQRLSDSRMIRDRGGSLLNVARYVFRGDTGLVYRYYDKDTRA
jgi:hypothetical protein